MSWKLGASVGKAGRCAGAMLANQANPPHTGVMALRISRLELFSPLLSALLLAACVTPPRPAPPAAPAPSQARPPVATPQAPSLGWEAAPLTPGSWAYRADAEAPAALFGLPASPAIMVIRCVRAQRQILVQRATRDPPGTLGTVQIHSSSRAATLRASVPFTGPVYMTAEVAAGDTLLDAIAFSRGKWRLTTPGEQDLILPRAAEVARVIEECRG